MTPKIWGSQREKHLHETLGGSVPFNLECKDVIQTGRYLKCIERDTRETLKGLVFMYLPRYLTYTI